MTCSGASSDFKRLTKRENATVRGVVSAYCKVCDKPGPSFMTTTNEIADKIAAEQNLTKAQAKTIVESIFKQITDAALAGAETSIPSFGKFKLKDTPEREGRTPATGATIKIAASRKLTFTPGKAVKDALNG